MIRWPFVLRGTHERVCEAAERATARAEAEHENAQALRHALVREESRADSERADRLAGDDRHRHELNALEDRHERAMVREATRYADLMASYRMLRLQGFTAPPSEPVREAKPVDPVMEAVNRHARDGKTKTAMLAQVAVDRQNNKTDVEIIARIERGNRPMDEVA